MITVIVGGERSGVGKTRLVEEILRNFPGWGAIKITRIRKNGCARDTSGECRLCSTFKGDWEIETQEEIILTPGKDTCRMRQAGAKRVVWLKAKNGFLKEGLAESLRYMKGLAGVVIEGTSARRVLKPDIFLFLKKDGSMRVEFNRRFNPLARAVLKVAKKSENI